MRTICAPSDANIFMDHFEQKCIYTLTKGKWLIYFRYFDDIFLIWTGTNNELDRFFQDLNKKQPSMNFDYKTSKYHFVFLDTEIYIHITASYTRRYTEKKLIDNATFT